MTTTVLVLDDTGAQYDLTTGASGSYVSYIPPGATGTWSWISELYGFQRQSGTFTPATGGTIGINPAWSRDTSVTIATESIVSAYTSLNNLDELYDYSCYIRRQDPLYVVLTAAAGKIFTTADIVLDGTTSTLWDYDDLTETLTIGTALLASGTTLTGIETTGTITLTNGAVITSLFTDSSGTSSKLNYSGLVNSTVYLIDNLGVQQDLQFNKTGTYIQYIPTTATGTWNWVVEGYGFQRQSANVNFVGGNYFAIIAYTPDANITQTTLATVAAYTEIATLNELYDYAAYMRTQEPQYVLASRNGVAVDFGSVNIVLDSTASAIWDYDSATNTLTVKSTNLASLTRFTTLLTTGTISLLNGSTITALYTSTAGPSARLNFSGLTASTIYVADNSNTQLALLFNKTGQHSEYYGPGLTGTYSWISERYGYQRLTGTFTPGIGGDFNVSTSWVPDAFITVTNSATVAAYTEFTNLVELYDYAAYMRTQEPQHNLATKIAATISFGNTDIVIDATASQIWSYNATTNTLTIKSSVLAASGVFTTIATTGTITFANSAAATCFYTDSVGSSVNLNYTNLTNSTIYTVDNAGNQFDLQLNKSGTFTNYIANTATGTWAWISERYAYQRQSGTFTPATLSGNYTAAPSWSPDIKITETASAIVSAYTDITTLDQLYDYAAYMRTQQPKYVLASANGTIMEFGSVNLVFDSTAASVWSYNSTTNTLTIKSTILDSGTNIVSVKTTGTITITGTVMQALYRGSTGPSARLTYSNLINSAIYTTDSSNLQYDLQIGLTGSLVNYFVPGLSGTYKWAAERYGYQRQTGVFTPISGGDFYASPIWVQDNNITETNSTVVAAYTSIATVDQLYDYASYMRTQEPQYVIATKNGTTLDLDGVDIVFDPTASVVWDYDNVANTLTIKTTALVSGTKMIKISTTGTITVNSGVVSQALLSGSNGNSARLNFTNLTNSSLYITDNTSAIYQTELNKTGPFTSYFDIGETGTWTWYAERYGYARQSGIFSPAMGGDISALPLWIADSSITQSTIATVAAYTLFDNVDQIYDYSAYMRTIDPQYVLATKNGTTIDFGNTNLAFDRNAAALWAYDPITNTLTLKTEVLISGNTFIKLKTTGLLTFTTNTFIAALYSHSGGNSSRVYYNDLIDSTVLTLTNTNTIYDMGTDNNDVIINVIDSGNTGSWTWNIERYGYRRQTGTFLPALGGDTNITPIWTADSYITVTNQATIAAYTSVSTLDQLYDLAAYMRTREPLYQLISTSGTTMNLGSTNLVLDATAATPWTYDSVTNTLTVKTTTLTPGIKSTQILTTGSVTFANGAITTAVYTNSIGTSTNFTITNIPTGSSLYIEDNTGTQVRYMSNVTTPVVVTYIAPGQTGNWIWTVEKYGNVRQSYIFTPGGGIQSSAVIASPDVSITEASQATVAAYASLEIADKVYDYIAYYRLSNAGIKLGSIATRSSFAVDFGTRSFTVDSTLSQLLSVTPTKITVKASSMSAGNTFTRLSTSAPGLITAAGSEPINLKFSDALGARATIFGLDPEGFGNTWYMRYKLSSASTYTYLSGTGNGVNLLVSNGTYSFEVREAGYEWTSMSLDTTNSLDLNMNLQYHKASDDTPQWNKSYDSAAEAIFSYDVAALKVAVNNVTGTLVQENFAEMYRAMQRIMHLSPLVWIWANPIRAIAATQTIIIPTGNPIAMFLTPASNASVRITCQVVHAADGTVAFDRVQGNASGFAIFLGTSQASEIASLRTDIVSDIVSKIGGTGFVTSVNSLVNITASLDDKPTLSEIEASDLAKEVTVQDAVKAAKLAAALSA